MTCNHAESRTSGLSSYGIAPCCTESRGGKDKSRATRPRNTGISPQGSLVHQFPREDLSTLPVGPFGLPVWWRR